MIPSHTLNMNSRKRGITTGVHLNVHRIPRQLVALDEKATLQNYNIHSDRAMLSFCAFSKGQRCGPVGLGILLKRNHEKLCGRVLPFHPTLAQFLSRETRDHKQNPRNLKLLKWLYLFGIIKPVNRTSF